MNEFDLQATAIIVVGIVVGLIVVVWIVRRKISAVSIDAAGIRAQVRTHKNETPTVSDIEQVSNSGHNRASIKNANVNVKGVSQKAEGNNNLSIGSD